MNNPAHHRPANSSLRQLEITFNQVSRSLRRALREAEKHPLPDLAASFPESENASFTTLAQAAGPAWQAVQLRCTLLRDLVEFSERLHALANPAPTQEASEPVPREPEPEPTLEGTALDHSPDPYELPAPSEDPHDDRDPMAIPLEELATLPLDELAAVRGKLLGMLAARAAEQGLPTLPDPDNRFHPE